MIFAVTGGREYNDVLTVDWEMSRRVQPGDQKTLVIQGGARGLDWHVKQWCRKNAVHCAEIEALWDFYPKAAGPIRNGVMLLPRPEFVLAFPGGAGTANMCKQAQAAGIPVFNIGLTPEWLR